MKKNGVIDIIEATLLRHDMLSVLDGAPIILMVSGGSDSVSAARILTKLLPEHRFTILHINHQLRGKDADSDEQFVIDLSHRLNLPCEIRRIDVATLAAQSGANIEQAGRFARYAAADELLDMLCQQAGINPAQGRIVTAHTLDERVETFFMRVIVGAGAGALSSIPYCNKRVIRPLLDCTRQELRTWLLQEGAIPGAAPGAPSDPSSKPLWREDATNYDTHHLRAFVRHELLPLAQSKNPELLSTIASSLNNLACDDRLLTDKTNELEQRLVVYEVGCENKNGVALARIDGALFDEDQALIRRLIQRVCKHLLPPNKRITSAHITNIAENGKHVGFVTVVCDAVTVVNEYGTLVFCREGGSAEGAGDSWSVSLSEACSELLPDGRMIELVRIAPGSFHGDPIAFVRANANDKRVFVDEARLKQAGGKLRLSPVGQGDKFCPIGMDGHHRLVSDLLIDRKIPRRLRSKICKLIVGNGTDLDFQDEIVWIVGVQLDDRFKVSETTVSMFSIIVDDSKTRGLHRG